MREREKRFSKANWLRKGADSSLLAASQNRRRACTAASCPPHEPAGHDLPSPRTPSAGLVSPWPAQEPAGHDGGLVRRLSARLPECLSSPIWRDTPPAALSGGFVPAGLTARTRLLTLFLLFFPNCPYFFTLDKNALETPVLPEKTYLHN